MIFSFLWFVGNLFSFCFVFVSFNSDLVYGRWYFMCIVCAEPVFAPQQDCITAKTLTLLHLPAYKHVVVCGIDGHEFRSSISSNHKFTFNAFLSSPAFEVVVVMVMAYSSSSPSKHHQFAMFLRIAWLWQTHTQQKKRTHTKYIIPSIYAIKIVHTF